MKHWMIGSVAAAALMAACGGGSEGGDDTEVTVTETQVGGDVLLPGLTLRSGDAAEAADALAAFSLTEGAPGRLGFGSVATDGANATFSDVTFMVPDDEDGDVPITAASLELVGLEMTDAGPSFSQMTLSDISASDPDGEEGELNVGSLQLTNPSPELAAWVATLLGDGEPGDFPDAGQVSFDGLSLANLTASGGDEDGNGQITIGSIDMRGMGPDKLQAAVFEGLTLNATDLEEGMDVAMELGSFQVSGAGVNLANSLLAASDEDEFLEAVTAATQQNPLEPGYDALSMSDLTFDVGGVNFDMPSLEATVSRNADGKAIGTSTKPFVMTLVADPNGPLGSQLAGPLQQMGFDKLELSGASESEIDPDTDRVSSSGYAELADGFRLAMDYDLNGIGSFAQAVNSPEVQDAVASDPSALLGAMSSLALNDMELVFEDQSILDKGFQFAAAMTGEDADSLKGQAQLGVGFLPLMGAQAGIDAEILTELSGALSSFLAEPGTLTLTFDPETPVTADMFQDPTQITKASLGFSASAE